MQYMLLLSLVEYWLEHQTRGRNLQNLEKKKLNFLMLRCLSKLEHF